LFGKEKEVITMGKKRFEAKNTEGIFSAGRII